MCICVYVCAQGFYRLGVAFQGLDAHEDAMVAYANGLVADPKQGSMLHGLIEAMLKSPFRGGCVGGWSDVSR